jgi:Protein of unknown function (DUF1553)/Protein of unknown function (DUF1549)/Planctomycete cytochrome C
MRNRNDGWIVVRHELLMNDSVRAYSLLLLLFFFPIRALADGQVALSFNRDIRPILSNHCFHCHGQDNATRESGLRLDTEEGQRTSQAVVPGWPDRSLIIDRIASSDPDVVMPPPDSNKVLSERDKDLLRRWVLEGAPFEKHWSLIAPRPVGSPIASPNAPSIEQGLQNPSPLQANSPPSSRNANPIDGFIHSKLRELGLMPSTEADKTTLIRRVTLDLTGLPPTPSEVQNFLNDNSDEAYEKVVDRLLQSPRYGERMALPWLDAARYADTHGYQKDNHRSMWLWRDWVIEAFNENIPFDQFTIEQLAGDLLENPNESQLIATGFNRNHRINAEAGSIDEEFLAEYASDRVETTATVWLGMTVGCARCHDHKFDPITQKDYYQLIAFFNNVEEKGVDGVGPAPNPQTTVSIAGFRERIESCRDSLNQLIDRRDRRLMALTDAIQEWEQEMIKAIENPQHRSLWILPQPSEITSAGSMKLTKHSDGSIFVSGDNPLNDVQTMAIPLNTGTISSFRLEAMRHPTLTDGAFARSYDGAFVLSGFEAEVSRPGQPAEKLTFRYVKADSERSQWPITSAIDDDPETGWSSDPRDTNAIHKALFVLDTPVEGRDGSLLTVRLRYESKEEQAIIGRFRLSMNATRHAEIDSKEWLYASIVEILKLPSVERSADQGKQLAKAFTQFSTDRELVSLCAEIEAMELELDQLVEQSSIGVMVMKESEKARETFINLRGAYDRPGERVFANTPACLPAISVHHKKEHDKPNRLDFARWLVSSDNPLTARVAVNRYWQMYFGHGLVKTSEDFGTQGEWPSHPELLDWLANEFVRSKWDVKGMQRLIVMSSTYRQSSRASLSLLEIDPENRWLGRGPRFRLPAHFIRDQALAVSGLLVPTIGGPPVKPYQPAGLWEGVAGINSNTTRYRQDSGSNLYRRSIYTYWKRAVPPPSMMIFDAADREVCNVKRRITNTPLQALTVMNDPTYIEASNAVASLLLSTESEVQAMDSARITWLFRTILARKPDAIELSRLQSSLDRFRNHFRKNYEAASSIVQFGESKTKAKINTIDLAVWTTVASVIFNLDEFLVKE